MRQRHASELGDLVRPEAAAYTGPCVLDGFQTSELQQLLRTMRLSAMWKSRLRSGPNRDALAAPAIWESVKRRLLQA